MVYSRPCRLLGRPVPEAGARVVELGTAAAARVPDARGIPQGARVPVSGVGGGRTRGRPRRAWRFRRSCLDAMQRPRPESAVEEVNDGGPSGASVHVETSPAFLWGAPIRLPHHGAPMLGRGRQTCAKRRRPTRESMRLRKRPFATGSSACRQRRTASSWSRRTSRERSGRGKQSPLEAVGTCARRIGSRHRTHRVHGGGRPDGSSMS